ncbi:MAG: dTDP-glucose pyrophosphorylase/CBS domain-containing protein [Paraglaciecola sp.]|jgi:dTDP-glucose pyrophosphorylase/CBS domain-containing protein
MATSMKYSISNWRDTCVSAETSIRQTLEVLNQSALKVVLVIDSNDALLGIVTDGDVRRTILKNIPMEEPISLIMNQQPITASKAQSKAQLIELMEKYLLLSIPIVTSSGIVIGLVSVHRLVAKGHHSTPVLLMAGGLGTRLSPLTNNCPKPLLKVGGSPLLELVLKSFVDAGFKRFYISTHYMPEKIRGYFGDGSRWGVNITYVHEDIPLGTAGALGMLPKSDIIDDLIVMNGDILTNIDFENLLTFHKENHADATMCVREYISQIPYGVIETDGYKITTIKEKPSSQHFVNAGIYVISPHVVHSLNLGEHIDMTTLLETCISNKRDVAVYPILDYWLDIGRLDDFQQAQIDVLTL